MKLQKILTHQRYADNKIKDIDSWKLSNSDKEDVKKFIEDYKSGEITNRIGSNPDATTERVLQLLRISLEYLAKNKKKVIGKFTKDNEEDIKKFKQAVLNDTLKNFYNKPFAIKGKKMIFITLKQYLKWKLEADISAILMKPLSIRIESKKPEPKFLTLEEIDKLYKNCKNNKERFVIAVLFGSGQRAEEFINNRFSDYTIPTKDENFVKLRIRDGFSKTQGRTITLYYDKCLEAIRDFLEERKQENIEPDEIIIKDSYANLRAWLFTFGRRVLKKDIHFHLFRSSCASWLANKLNRQQLCYYFGWNFNSNMPDVYISRKGLIMEDVNEVFEKTEMEELKQQLKKEKEKSNLEVDGLKKQFETIKKLLISNTNIGVQDKEKQKENEQIVQEIFFK